jgi:hypothetical protein
MSGTMINPPPRPRTAPNIPTKQPRARGRRKESNVKGGGSRALAVFRLVRSLPHALQGLEKHGGSHDTEHNHIGDPDKKIGLSQTSQLLDDLHAQRAADPIAEEKKDSHFQIHIAHAVVRISARCGGGYDLVGIRSGSHRRRDSNHNQQGGHEETSSHTEKAGNGSDHTAQPQEQKQVSAVSGDRQIKIPQDPWILLFLDSGPQYGFEPNVHEILLSILCSFSK